jgi:type I restriction enzyme R subunit
MQSLNFELLRTYASDLAEHGAFAEHYAYTDPASAVVKLRIVAEQLVLHICDCLSLQLPSRPKLCDLLEHPSFQRVAPKAIRYKIDAVRIHGNHGAHGQKVSVDTALCMLRETYRIVCWFFLVYVREARSGCPSYQEPAPPPESDSARRAVFSRTLRKRRIEREELPISDLDEDLRMDSGIWGREPEPEELAEKKRPATSPAKEESSVLFSRRREAFRTAPESEEEPSVDLAAMKKRTTLRQRLGKQGMLTAGIRGSLAARRATRA